MHSNVRGPAPLRPGVSMNGGVWHLSEMHRKPRCLFGGSVGNPVRDEM